MMNGEELRRRLDGRTHAWLAKHLGVTRGLVWKWAHDQKPVPEEHACAIRERLPLPDDERVVRGGDG